MNNLHQRINDEINYLIKENLTIREIAKKCNISKSTVHKDFREKLPTINSYQYEVVSNILNNHKQERHIRGGEATKNKYKEIDKNESRKL